MWFDGVKRYHHRVPLNDSGKRKKKREGKKGIRIVRDGVLSRKTKKKIQVVVSNCRFLNLINIGVYLKKYNNKNKAFNIYYIYILQIY